MGASEAVRLAEAEVATYEPERLKVLGEKESKAAMLENFKQYNMGGFELLKDQSSKPVAAPPVHAELPAGNDTIETIPVSPTKLDGVAEDIRTEAPITVGGA